MPFHRSAAAVAACVVSLCLAVPAAADSISYTLFFNQTVSDPDATANLFLTQAGNSPVDPKLFDGEYSTADSGSTFTATAADPDFAIFETLLTNGSLSNDIFFGLQGPSSVSYFGTTESSFSPLPNPGTDLQGFDVTAIKLTFNSLFVFPSSPGTLSVSGDATITVDYQPISVVPTPSAAMGGMALFGLLALRRRSA